MRDFSTIIAIRGVQGFVGGAFVPAALAYVPEAVPERWRTLGLTLMGAGFLASILLGQIYGVIVFPNVERFSSLFIVPAIAFAAFAVLLWRLPRGDPPARPEASVLGDYRPEDLMDPAFLRRIPYNIELFEPTKEDFRTIFDMVSDNSGLKLTDEIFDYVVEQLQVNNEYELAYYQPKFICDQVLAACKYENIPPMYTMDRVADALKNLYVQMNMDPPPKMNEISAA